MRRLGIAALVAYIATIFGANWALQRYGLVPVGFGLIAPAGVFFAGLAFTFRDIVQDGLGRKWTVAAIVAGAALSYAVAPSFAIPSGIAFLLSEGADFAVYSPIRERRWLTAVVASNIVGFVFDSVLFLWLAFGSLAHLDGQLVGKFYMTAIPVAALWLWRQQRQIVLEAK